MHIAILFVIASLFILFFLFFIFPEVMFSIVALIAFYILFSHLKTMDAETHFHRQKMIKQKIMKGIKFTVSYPDVLDCPKSKPFKISIFNGTKKTLYNTSWWVNAQQLGYSTIYSVTLRRYSNDGMISGALKTDKILKPKENMYRCYLDPQIKNVDLHSNLNKKELKYIVKAVTFGTEWY